MKHRAVFGTSCRRTLFGALLRRTALIAFVALAIAAPAGGTTSLQAQDPLDQVEALLASGRLTDARNTLDRWIAEHPPGARSATSEQQAHALLLQGRVNADLREAEEAYLAVVLSYPTSRYAPQALLRLGQVLVAIGMADGDPNEAARGAAYLERLLDDHPGSEQGPVATLWLARAHQVAGAHDDACRVAREGAELGATDPTLDSLLRQERDAACAAVQQDAPPAARAEATPAGNRNDPSDSPASGVARFAVQSTAVRNRAAAESLAARLRRTGFEPRVVQIDGSSLYRVRVGRYVSAAEATAVARRVRSTGFEAVVVTDAHRERR
jgi:cell division septation protein DedD